MSAKRIWRASPADDSLAKVLAHLGDVAGRAVTEGRVFINGVRAEQGVALDAGDVVEVWDARTGAVGALRVLHEADGLIVVDKPAGLPTEPDHRGSRSLVEDVAALLASRSKRRHTDAHPVSRLDAGVSGAVVFATTKDARRQIEAASARSGFVKTYIAIVAGAISGSGEVNAPIGGKPATSRYDALASARGATLVELEPVTGRTHQLRIHMASLGAPIFGDRTRGGPTRITDVRGGVHAVDRIMLHAVSVRLALGRANLEVGSPIPLALTHAWGWLDGDAGAWKARPLEK